MAEPEPTVVDAEDPLDPLVKNRQVPLDDLRGVPQRTVGHGIRDDGLAVPAPVDHPEPEAGQRGLSAG